MRSYLFPQLGKQVLGDGYVKLPSLGKMPIHQSTLRLRSGLTVSGVEPSRSFPDGFKAKQARVVKRASGYYVMIWLQSELSVPELTVTGKAVGIDVGLEYFLSTSEGTPIERPVFFVDLQSELKLLQRRLKNKVKGSNNWKKVQNKVSRLHERIANTRVDFHLKVAQSYL